MPTSARGVAEILGLAGEDADLIAVGEEVADQRLAVVDRRELAGEQALQRMGGEADMAVGARAPRCPARASASSVGRHRPAVDAPPDRVGAGAFEHDQDDVALAAGDDRRAARRGAPGEGEIAAEAVLVDAVAGNVERIGMAAAVERLAVEREGEEAPAVAVEVGRLRGAGCRRRSRC